MIEAMMMMMKSFQNKENRKMMKIHEININEITIHKIHINKINVL